MQNMLGWTLILFLFLGSGTSFGGSLATLLPDKDLPEGWSLMEGPRIYNQKTLFDHINGQGELFLQYGFQSSVFAIYQNRHKKEHQIEIDLYDMGNVLQAFGIFSRFRNEDRPGGVGLDSYFEDQSAFFYKGRYFVMFYSTEPNFELLRAWAQIVSNKILDSSAPPKEIAFFPKEGFKPGSLQYFPKGLLGRKFLNRGFQGIYYSQDQIVGKEFILFLSLFKSPQGAGEGLKMLKGILSKRGKIVSKSPPRFGKGGVFGEDPYHGKILVLQKGFYLLGAAGFEKEGDLEKPFTEFLRRVK
ncbi:MAG: DUF6599 family protein [Thermodesulfobacteriota bacterium]